MTDYDYRTANEPIEVRSTDGKVILAGTAIRYGARSRDLNGFRERIMPGAASEPMQKGDVLALHEHEVRNLLGRLSSGTLRLIDSPAELRYEIDLPDTTVGHEVAHLVERGDIKGSSFGFRADPTKVKWTIDDGMALRSVHGFKVFRDVSTTAMPAYENGLLTLRSFGVETGLDVDYRSVTDAADRGELAELLAGVDKNDPPEDEEAPITRRPAAWFV